jgi:hypothetical protein
MFGKKTREANQRFEPRYHSHGMAAYTDEGSDVREKLINVSLSGCCLETPVNIETGEHILIHFLSSDNSYTIENSFCLDCSIAWKSQEKNGSFHYGFQFSEPRSQFFLEESRAFREEVTRIACRQHLTASFAGAATRNTTA